MTSRLAFVILGLLAVGTIGAVVLLAIKPISPMPLLQHDSETLTPEERQHYPYAPTTFGSPTSREPSEKPTTSSANNAVSGRVLNTDRNPIGGASVMMYDANAGGEKTTSLDDGTFTIERLSTDKTYRLSATADGYNELIVENTTASNHDLELVLSPSSSVAGTVVDKTTGTPIGDFYVAYLPVVPASESEWQMQALTDAVSWRRVVHKAGEFTISNIASQQDFAIAARADGYSAELIPCKPAAAGEAVSGIAFELARGAAITGVVLTPDGAPASDSDISIGPNLDSLVQTTRTSARGEFRIDAAPTDRLIVRATHPAYDSADAEVTPSPRSDTKLTLQLRLAGTIEGLVTINGAPADGQRVVASGKLGSNRFAKSAEAVTDPAGRYRITGLPGGSFDVIATYAESPEQSNDPLQLNVSAEVSAGQVTVVDFPFKPSAATIEGHVTIGGHPAKGAEIAVAVGSGELVKHASAISNDDGAYRIEGLPSGAAFLEARISSDTGADLKQESTFTLAENERAVHDIDFSGQSGIFGIVEGLSPGEIAEVIALPGTPDVSVDELEELLALRRMAAGVTSTNETGAYRLEGIAPGDYTVVAIVINPDDDAGDPLESLRIANQNVTIQTDNLAELNLTP